MESNITLYYFIFSKPFSANKQHKYTHNGSKNQSFLYNKNGITHKLTHEIKTHVTPIVQCIGPCNYLLLSIRSKFVHYINFKSKGVNQCR